MINFLISVFLMFMLLSTEALSSEEFSSMRAINLNNKCTLELLPGGNKRVKLFESTPWLGNCEVIISKTNFEMKYKYCFLTGFQSKETNRPVAIRHFFSGQRYYFDWSNVTFAYYTCMRRK